MEFEDGCVRLIQYPARPNLDRRIRCLVKKQHQTRKPKETYANSKQRGFSLDLGLFKLETELSDEDRQCAWELYTEITTRVAVVGKRDDKAATNFEGELYLESLESLYNFFKESRLIMRRFPFGRTKDFNQEHLGILIHRMLNHVLRPFLEKWNAQYRVW